MKNLLWILIIVLLAWGSIKFAAYYNQVKRQSEGPTPEEIGASFQAILTGEAEPALIAAFLMGLRTRGETVEDIVAGVRVMRANMVPANAPEGAIDTCGTGGLSWTSLNTSTAVAFVAAGAGVVVAKHGNRRVSSKSGSADVLEALIAKVPAPKGDPAAPLQALQISGQCGTARTAGHLRVLASQYSRFTHGVDSCLEGQRIFQAVAAGGQPGPQRPHDPALRGGQPAGGPRRGARAPRRCCRARRGAATARTPPGTRGSRCASPAVSRRPPRA